MSILNEVFEYETEPDIYCFCDHSESEHHCLFCNESSFSNFISFNNIKNNLKSFLILNDEDFLYIIRQLKKHKYDCPECSSIDDPDYYCLSCEGSFFNGVDFLIYFLKNQKAPENDINLLYEKINKTLSS